MGIFMYIRDGAISYDTKSGRTEPLKEILVTGFWLVITSANYILITLTLALAHHTILIFKSPDY